MRDTAREDFREYVVTATPGLLRTAYLMTGNRHDAEDLVQSALANTYLAWSRIRNREAIDAYVRRAMYNLRTSLWRRTRGANWSSIDQLADLADADAGAAFEAAELRDALREALRRLTERQRMILILRQYEDRSIEETAQILGIAKGTVKSTLSDAMSRLREDAVLRQAATRSVSPK